MVLMVLVGCHTIGIARNIMIRPRTTLIKAFTDEWVIPTSCFFSHQEVLQLR